MKAYPTNEIRLCNDDLSESNMVIYVPTPEALKNFNNYLEEDEKIFYDALTPIKQLQVAISCDPFRALLGMMGKL